MKEETLTSPKIADFINLVENWKMDWNIGERAIFRGHTDFNWILISKLFRDPDAKPENHIGDDPPQIEKQLLSEHLTMKEAHDIEHRLFHDFSRYLFAYRPDLISPAFKGERSNTQVIQEWRQLALAQHYGIPTRFLDFTTNMLVALFFAVEDKSAYRKTTKGELQVQDSAVWCVEVPNRWKIWQIWKKGNDWLSPLDFAEEGSKPPIANFVDTAFVPEHIDERIRAQGSVFLCEPRGKNIPWTLHERLRNKEVIETHDKKPTETLRIRIPHDMRESLKEQLDLIGINCATLFPDLGSVARYLTWAVYQRKRPFQR